MDLEYAWGGGGGRAINSLSVTLYLLIYWISAAPVTNPQNGINEHRPNATNITDTEPDGPSSYRHNHRAVQPRTTNDDAATPQGASSHYGVLYRSDLAHGPQDRGESEGDAITSDFRVDTEHSVLLTPNCLNGSMYEDNTHANIVIDHDAFKRWAGDGAALDVVCSTSSAVLRFHW